MKLLISTNAIKSKGEAIQNCSIAGISGHSAGIFQTDVCKYNFNSALLKLL